MPHEFGYNAIADYADYVTIDNVFDVAIEAVDSDGRRHYLVIRTAMGKYHALSFGPIYEDSDDVICDGYEVKYQEGDSDDRAVCKAIRDHLKPKKRDARTKGMYGGRGQPSFAKIEAVNVIGIDEALANLVDVGKYMSVIG